ncbi:hypothetical protein [Pseudactinotalea sp. HY160]|uniref:antitoxin VbhA family protein n=1 Tax=Pseudactinotalea sp. HY160 TaxID=2654490 RepID=UPI00351BC653
MATTFDIEERWPELFAQLDETQRRAVVQSLASAWHEGWTPNREDVENLTDEARGAIDAEEYRRRAHAAVERQRAMPQQRVFFRDVKPYEVPEKLEDLKGPVGGVVDLPHTVLWAPGCGRVDLDAEGGAGLAYRAVLSEGTLADQVAVVNRDRLMAVWPGLLLPRRVRELWEARFPELRAVVSA